VTPTGRLLAALGAAITARRFYPADHPRMREAMDRLEAVALEAVGGGEVTLLELEGTLVVDGVPPEGHVPPVLVRALAATGVDLVRVAAGVTRAELERLVEFLAGFGEEELPRLEHVTVGKAHLGGAAEGGTGGPAAAPEAVARDRVAVVAEGLAPAREGHAPDGRALLEVVESLDGAAARVARAGDLLAPAEAASWHEVHAHNVAALALLLARAAGLARAARVDLGLAALVHDIGLLGSDPVTIAAALEAGEEELAVAPDHPRRGLELLVGDPVLPPLAAVVAWEHHWPAAGERGRSPHVAARLVAVADRADLARWRDEDAAGAGGAPAGRDAEGLDPDLLSLLVALGAGGGG